MAYNDRIAKAIADLNAQERPNVNSTAEKYSVKRKTLENRQKGKTVSIEEANYIYRQALTNAQESSLIGIINDLTNRNMPPTSAIVKNLAEKIRGEPLKKNWVYRHKDELKSQYLTNIDNKRVKEEFSSAYQEFYKLVKCYFALL